MSKRGGKTPAIKKGIEALGQKVPVINAPVIDGMHLAWRFSSCDKDGPYAWPIALTHPNLAQIFDRINEFEQKTWEELHEMGCHPIECYQLDKSARDRLQAIQLDDLDELMSFRVTGAQRIWCVRNGHIMRILWWDPEHKVYPTPRDKADRQKAKKKRGW